MPGRFVVNPRLGLRESEGLHTAELVEEVKESSPYAADREVRHLVAPRSYQFPRVVVGRSQLDTQIHAVPEAASEVVPREPPLEHIGAS